MVAQDRGDLAEAERWYRESLAINERFGDDRRRAITLVQLGRLAEGLGQAAEAVAFYRQAEQIFERIGDARHLELTRRNLRRVQPT
jgi:tetratricopeptide (TPR) repeat protein